MSDTLIHEYSLYSYYTGNSRVIGPMEGIPLFWTDAPMPEIPAGQYAMFVGGKWIINSQPQQDPPSEPFVLPSPKLAQQGPITSSENSPTVL